jgi:stress response protein YsnF
MARTVLSRFESEALAEAALSRVAGEVALLDSAVLTAGLAASLTLDGLGLTPEERSACEAELNRGGYLLVAQAPTDAAAEAVLQSLASDDGAIEPQLLSEAPQPESAAEAAAEELRIGEREIVRGGARVRSFTREVPVQETVELFEEEASVSSRPVNRRLTDDEVVKGGLLQDRVVEVTQMREEAVVTKEAFVREELIVTKTVEQRVEQINETLRRTEVETERVEGSAAAEWRAGRRTTPQPPG